MISVLTSGFLRIMSIYSKIFVTLCCAKLRRCCMYALYQTMYVFSLSCIFQPTSLYQTMSGFLYLAHFNLQLEQRYWMKPWRMFSVPPHNLTEWWTFTVHLMLLWMYPALCFPLFSCETWHILLYCWSSYYYYSIQIRWDVNLICNCVNVLHGLVEVTYQSVGHMAYGNVSISREILLILLTIHCRNVYSYVTCIHHTYIIDVFYKEVRFLVIESLSFSYSPVSASLYKLTASYIFFQTWSNRSRFVFCDLSEYAKVNLYIILSKSNLGKSHGLWENLNHITIPSTFHAHLVHA